MELDKHIRDNAARRESFMALAERVFGLSFREWYAGGWWSERYRPYVLAHGDRVLACIATPPGGGRIGGISSWAPS